MSHRPTVIALYDFTDNQWHNQLRLRRILVRGSEGEITDEGPEPYSLAQAAQDLLISHAIDESLLT